MLRLVAKYKIFLYFASYLLFSNIKHRSYRSKCFYIKIYLKTKFYIFLETFFYFLRVRKSFLLKTINSMHFQPKKIFKKYKFDLQSYFNIEKTLNGWIGVLNSKMRDTTRIIKIFCISRLTKA
jgi:hypothetical protein